jgi:high-affinity Fe2+/Pb2+ permease
MQADQHLKNDRDFYRVVQVSSALGLGIVAAFLYSIREVNPSIRFEFSIGSIVAFLLAAAASWIFWRNLPLRSGESAPAGSKRRWLLLATTVLVVGMVGFFAYGLRNVSGHKLREIVEGTLLAVALVGFLSWVVWKLFRLIQSDHDRAIAPPEDSEDES